jgi:hypothetical protein
MSVLSLYELRTIDLVESVFPITVNSSTKCRMPTNFPIVVIHIGFPNRE